MKKRTGETQDQILDLAELLIQTRGYSAFSYQDIALSLDIRKASIHYYFPSKTDLGLAVITRYSHAFSDALESAAQDEAKSTKALFALYTAPYLQFAETPDRVCLCGALAGEILALPATMRTEVENFFCYHQQWLTNVLRRGKERGEIKPGTQPAKAARLIFGALQGALLVKRTTGDHTQMKDVVDTLRKDLLV